MTIGVISGAHSCSGGLTAALKETDKEGVDLIVNSGGNWKEAVSKPFDEDYRTPFVISDFEKGIRVSFRHVDYDVEINMKALIDAGLPAEIGIMLRRGRDSHID